MAAWQVVGTARSIADEMQEWLESEGSDGFNVMFAVAARAGCRTSSSWCCPSCAGAAWCAPSTMEVPCASTWGCSGRGMGSAGPR
jgi:hypothetical protein